MKVLLNMYMHIYALLYTIWVAGNFWGAWITNFQWLENWTCVIKHENQNSGFNCGEWRWTCNKFCQSFTLQIWYNFYFYRQRNTSWNYMYGWCSMDVLTLSMYLFTSSSGSSLYVSTGTSFVGGLGVDVISIGAGGGVSCVPGGGVIIGDGWPEWLLPVLGEEGECGMVTVGVSIGRSLL